MSRRGGTWLVVSVAVPIIGAAGAAQLVAVARGTAPSKVAPGATPPPHWATEQAGWYAAGIVCALVSVVIAIPAKK
jgi:hypothetical protein